ncbi:MAG: SecD/SecF fusion protein [Chlamydiales bacterium]|jgi:SecD/SecF fusion protein
MVENLGRKIVLILIMLAGAVISLLFAGFRLGLDLQGGTRLVYSLPIDEALADGTITAQEAANPRELINQFIGIIKERIDPQGVREPIVRPEGDNRIVIELPGAGTEVRHSVSAGLSEALAMEGASVTLDAVDETIKAFPGSGGVIQIDGEKLRYRKKIRNTLTGVQRGVLDTPKAAHAAGAEVRLINADPWQELIENVGNLGFYILAKDSDFNQETDLTAERSKVEAWVDANENVPIAAFNKLPYAEGGTWGRLEWFPYEDDGVTPLKQRLQPLIVQEDVNWRFTGEDLASVRPSQDQLGYPAVGFDMSTETRSAFSDFTGAHIEQQMAIVINGEIATFPRINSRLPGGGIIEGGAGGFTMEEVLELVTVLRSGSLKIKPELEHRERVGATLGDDYVARGALSCIIALGAVLLFIIFYYRRLGLFAGISLLVNLTLLMGALSFLQATLTLPGVAGIILTVGMAVDANILIYERIREEALRGRRTQQAAKDGFANATSTIIDANLTTLITGWILYIFGTGPVRGFATTLCIGIITSVFCALVITRILVHIQLEKGIKEFSMARFVSDTKIAFMAKRKNAYMLSSVLITAGLALFISIPTKQKLGIDFLGGVTMTVRTQSPQDVKAVRERVQGIEGLIGKSSEVKAILASESGDKLYTQFRVTSKADGGDNDDSKTLKDTVENEVRSALADMLEKGPYEISVDGTAATGTLYFESTRDLGGVETLLGNAGVTDIQLSQVTGPAAAYLFSGTVGLEKDTVVLSQLIEARFAEGLDGVEYRWANTVPEVAVVGAQVVGELRDKAIFAILLSLFAAVMYIRVRFAEYSYGWAAVIALVHDVLITLGVLAVAMKFDLIEVEINLPMIAAFLTIIGYSLNDTIVVFDRIRENMPRMKGDLSTVIDRSINQTLSRTLLTSLTTLTTVLILLAFNLGSRNVLEGFAFALSIGVIVGTYSSMFIACPSLLWLEGHRIAKHEAEAAEQAKKPQIQAT